MTVDDDKGKVKKVQYDLIESVFAHRVRDSSILYDIMPTPGTRYHSPFIQ